MGLATRIPTLVDRFNPPALAGGCLVVRFKVKTTAF